ncbi:MAG TPA: endonuclease [Phycisphaerae bacterium]|nr:endonuclease [Phycisphaerae bacterium]
MGIGRNSPRSARARQAIVCLLCTLVSTNAFAAYEAPDPAFNPPAGYYAGATGTGDTLRLNLHTIISANFTGISYGDARADLPIMWTDPANSLNMILVYDHTSIVKPTGGSIPGWEYSNNVLVWNREHIWPQSWLGVSVGNSYVGPASDLFELAPANPNTNGGRGNDGYGSVTSSGAPAVNGSYYYPGDTDKGDIARSLFYMATRYYTGSGTLSIQNLQLVNGSAYSTFQMGDLQSLLKYNYTDGVDNFERARNEINYNQFQHNRNPFIDHPEYVWAIFGYDANGVKLNNTSQLSVSTPDAGGASSTTVNLGRIFVGGTLGTANVTFTKTGTTPTTFDIITGGNATTGTPIGNTTLGAGTGQVIDYNNQTRTIVAGLNASTATSGVKTGTITIHNTDLTSAGTGQGSADGDDTISVSATVYQHASPSFTVGPVTPALTIDFGIIPLNAAAPSHTFTIANRQSTALAAGLDLTGSSLTGSTAFSTNAAAFQNLAAGAFQTFSATLDTSTFGSFSATDIFHLSDDHTIPGALSSDFTLTLTGIVAMPGDANVDGHIDLTDLSVVLNNFGQATSDWTAGNFDGSSSINLTDLSDVLNNFGFASSAPSAVLNSSVATSAPEPASIVLFALGAMSLTARNPTRLRKLRF